MALGRNAENRASFPKWPVFNSGVFILQNTSSSFCFPDFYWLLGKAYSFGANGHLEAHVS